MDAKSGRFSTCDRFEILMPAKADTTLLEFQLSWKWHAKHRASTRFRDLVQPEIQSLSSTFVDTPHMSIIEDQCTALILLEDDQIACGQDLLRFRGFESFWASTSESTTLVVACGVMLAKLQLITAVIRPNFAVDTIKGPVCEVNKTSTYMNIDSTNSSDSDVS